MLKPIIAVVTGFIVWTFLWLATGLTIGAMAPEAVRPDTPVTSAGVLLALLGMSVICSLIAGATCALIGSRSAAGPAIILGVILLLVGIGVQASAWRLMPIWYHLPFLVLLLPMTWLGWVMVRGGRTAEPAGA